MLYIFDFVKRILIFILSCKLYKNPKENFSDIQNASLKQLTNFQIDNTHRMHTKDINTINKFKHFQNHFKGNYKTILPQN